MPRQRRVNIFRITFKRDIGLMIYYGIYQISIGITGMKIDLTNDVNKRLLRYRPLSSLAQHLISAQRGKTTAQSLPIELSCGSN